MPALILQLNEQDGTVLMAAVAQVPPELMQNAQQVGSVEEAAKVVGEVLGDGTHQPGGPDGQGAAPGADDTQGAGQGGVPDDSAQDGKPEPDEDDAMDQGFGRARKGF